MNRARVIFLIAKADFLERVRRYRFLAMLGLVLWIGYLSASGTIRMRVAPDHIGVINSAWVGGTMAVTVSFLLGWVGFYIVRGSIERDYTTGVGQIMATTPLSRAHYLLGKWLSNFAVLGITIVILFVEGILMNSLLGVEGFSLSALAAPLVVIALPAVALTAAFAVLFESIRWLRGGAGNIVYFFAFLALMITSTEAAARGGSNPYLDFSGWQIIGDSVTRAAAAAYPQTAGGFTFSFTALEAPKFFIWNGVAWTGDILLSRILFLGVAAGIVLLSTLFFDRFKAGGARAMKRGQKSARITWYDAAEPVEPGELRLSRLGQEQLRVSFWRLLQVELNYLLKGRAWWWYGAAAGLVLFQLLSSIEMTRTWLIAAWVWPVLVISKTGCRENLHNTGQLAFCAPYPVRNQLPAAWLSVVFLLALLGSGALLRFLLAGEIYSGIGWLTGAFFISSLALLSGVLTGSSKTFEVVHIVWMYLLLQRIEALDFLGFTPGSPLPVYAGLAVGLAALAFLARTRQQKQG